MSMAFQVPYYLTRSRKKVHIKMRNQSFANTSCNDYLHLEDTVSQPIDELLELFLIFEDTQELTSKLSIVCGRCYDRAIDWLADKELLTHAIYERIDFTS